MRKAALAAALLLIASGCSTRDVNEYSLFKYRSDDDPADTALKTAGNILPWAGEAVLVGAYWGLIGSFYLGIGYIQSSRGS